jgi:murein DD-endopeptidase MepM/ murein hydrolase activator NlpD
MYNIPVLKPYRVTQWRWERPNYYKPRSQKWHPWIDYAWSSPWIKQNVYASKSGIVVQSLSLKWRGETIVIRHEDNVETIYAHLSSRAVKVWQVVWDMQYIWITGTTGNSNGVHLHFWMRPSKSDPAYNPNNWYAWWIDPTSILWKQDIDFPLNPEDTKLVQEALATNSDIWNATQNLDLRYTMHEHNKKIRDKFWLV